MNPIRSESANQAPAHFPLAIVGMGCRFPGGADDVELFWKLVAEGRSGIREVPADRWDRNRFYHPDSAVPGTMVTKWGGFIDNLDRFDAHFWGITPREAMRMDPQQRWLLEVAWEAIEDSGTPPKRLRGTKAGVFVGIATTDFSNVQMSNFAGSDVHTNSGCTLSIASNRISYLLDLRGPSMSVDTACSSALVAVWAACQSIWSGASSAALAGGVNALITPHATIGFSKASMLSPTGQCFAFDARANGYVRGEGAGMVYIKPLQQALADNDRIYAVIRAAVSNQDGHTTSMTVPGVEGQSILLRQAYSDAGLSPRRVVYMEAHGTGTPVGDPIEATALGRVLGEGRPTDQPCLIGSVKTNIGHLEAGSGVAGLIKAALVLHKDQVPPNRNFETPNPHIPFNALGLKVATELQALPRQNGLAPVTAVNSFGFGGTNAHVVLEQAPPRIVICEEAKPTADRPYLLPISARDEKALRKYVDRFRSFLANSKASLSEICYSAGERKDHHGHRLIVTGSDAAQMRRRLGAWLRGGSEGVVAGRAAANPSQAIFVFTGQGAQWWAMGRELLKREPVFRQTIERIDRLLQPLATWSLVQELQREEKDSNIDRTDIAQPAIFAVQVALAELWKSWGIEPAKVVGHSVGEVAAAFCAGIYSLEDAVKVIYHRSRLQNQTGGHGRMLAAGISAAEARRAIGADAERVHIAVINSSNLVTLAGDTEPLEQIAARLEQEGKFTRWLRINYAFHTHQMDPIKDELLRVLADLQPRAAKIPFVSTVTGGLLNGERLDAMYWWKNVRYPVLFSTAITNLIRGNAETFLELGPHPALAGSINDCLKEQGRTGHIFHSLRRGADESNEILTNLAGLHVLGMPIDWAAVNQSARQFVSLPQYPWNREPFWLESQATLFDRLDPAAHPFLNQRLIAALPTWEFKPHPRRFPYLNDHRIWDSIVMPGACYAEIGIALARKLFPGEPYAVEDLEIKKALFITEEDTPTVNVVFDPETKTYSVFSAVLNSKSLPVDSVTKDTADKTTWELHAQARLTKMEAAPKPSIDLLKVREPLHDHFDHEAYYADMSAAGYQFGPNFKHIRNVWRVHGEALAEIVVPEAIRETIDAYEFQPAVMDACFHIFKGLKAHGSSRPEDNFYLPHSIRRVRLFTTKPPARLWAHGQLVLDDGKSLVCDIIAYDDQGAPVAEIQGFRADRAEQKQRTDNADNCYYQFRFEPRRLRGRGIEGTCAFPTVEHVTSAVRSAAQGIHEKFSLDEYHHRFGPRAETVVCQLVQNAWIELGWTPRLGERFTTDEAIRKLDIAEGHQQLARFHLNLMESFGLLRKIKEDEWEVLQLPRKIDISGALDSLAAEFPRFESEVALHRQVAPNLAKVLSGDLDPVEVLFPGGSMQMLERFYAEGGDIPAETELIRTAVAKAIESLPRGRVLRILEVGAGTGALTRAVLPILPADRTEYTFTDIGPAFLTAAKKQFGQYGFIDYKTFDLEKDPQTQGIEPESYDLILGTLVLHATADLKQTLTALRQCLSGGGLLMVNELFPGRAMWTSVFGLLKGWWRFTDKEIRTHSPLLPPAQWLALLKENGFVSSGFLGTFADTTKNEQGVLMAFTPEAVAKDTPATSQVAAGGYLVLADKGGVADGLIARLRKSGHAVSVVRRGEAFRNGGGDWVVDPNSEEDLRRVLAGLPVPAEKLAGVIHCWSLDHPRANGLTLEQLQAAQDIGVVSGLRLTHVLAESPPPNVWFVTRDIYGERSGGVASAPIIGLARVATNEVPTCRFSILDLDAAKTPAEIEDLFQEVTAGDGEMEVTYRDGRRLALRLGRLQIDQAPMRKVNAVRSKNDLIPFRLQTDKPGVLARLSLNETQRRTPEANEIEIRVRAGGINFRDVLKALAMYPGNPIDLLWFGDDIAGTVERVGANIRHLKAGDNVVGIAPYGFQSYVTTDARTVFKKPPTMTFEAAATVPTVFLTAHYAIVELARMQSGESILIHAGTGGVGMAAIQIAKRLGLEIFATAGTPEKRQLLHDMGVKHVLNSRTLEFADEITKITKGKGVDAVLNSLAGDFIPKSMSVLAPFGRFLEIGKIDIYRNSKIGLEQLKNNISYFVIDLASHLQHRPDRVAGMFQELGQLFASGEYQPLVHTAFPITKVAEAFRHMAQGKHIGKNVLSFDVPEIPIGPCTDPAHRFRADASYLITGGAGGFSLEVAKWMAKHGARNLVLFSRSGPRDQAVQDIEQLRANGVKVLDVRGDVTKLEDVRRAVTQAQSQLPPLKGVLHGAMVLDDDFLANLDDSRFMNALSPKMAGAWNLHVATAGLPLEHFVCFSSFSGVVGYPQQSNYNAGNIFLECLARHRHAQGLPALTISWGAILGAGFVERNKKTANFLDKIGMSAFSLEEALRVYGQSTLHDPVDVITGRVDWRLVTRASPLVGNSKTYAALTGESAQAERGGSLAAQLQAVSPEGRLGLIEDFISAQVAGVFGVTEDKVDRETPLTSLGLDSLMAVELTNRLEREIGNSIPMGSLLGGPTIKVLSHTVLKLVSQSLTADASSEDGPAVQVSSGELLPLEKAVPASEEFPLSERQQSLWKLCRQDPGNPAFTLTFSARLRPAVDVEAMRRSFAALVRRHPMLTVTFSEASGKPLQRLHRSIEIPFREHDVRDIGADQIKQRLVNHAGRAFNLERGPVVRLDLFRTRNGSHIAVLAAHRLVADARSMTILAKELFANYAACLAGEEPRKQPAAYSYQDFVAWENKQLAGVGGKRLADFWKRQLKDAPLALDLPTDRTRPPVQTLRGAAFGFKLDDELTHQLHAFSAEQNVPVRTALLAAYQILMHRWCHQGDLVLGCTLRGRGHRELADIVGSFSYPAPLRSKVDDDPTIEEFIKRASQGLATVSDSQLFSLPRLVQELNVPADVSRPPLIQACFTMEGTPADEPAIPVFLLGQSGYKFHSDGIAVEAIDLPAKEAACELTLAMEEADGAIYGSWEYNCDLFESTTISRINELFARTLKELTRGTCRHVSELAREGFPARNGSLRRKDLAGAHRYTTADNGVDYIAEAKLDPSIMPPPNVAVHLDKLDKVFLTGATGYLGAFLLDEILRETDAHVFCLVRAKTTQQAYDRIAENLQSYGLTLEGFQTRISPIVGDLEKPLLGLSEADFNRLATEIDAIYHNGAIVNLISAYEQLRGTNVNGTREVIRLAMRSRPKPLHYVSTFAVLATSDRHALSVATEDEPLPPFEKLPVDYQRSKCVSESLLQQASARGLPVTVYRPGNISGHSRTGVCNALDYVHTLVVACSRMRAFPQLETEVDVTPVDYVSRSIVALSKQPECFGRTYHLVNPQPLRLPRLVGWLQGVGADVDLIPYERWYKKLVALVDRAPDEVVAPLMQLLGPIDPRGEAPRNWHPRYDCQNAISSLTPRGIVCPAADDQLLDTYLSYMLRSGRLELKRNGRGKLLVFTTTPRER